MKITIKLPHEFKPKGFSAPSANPMLGDAMDIARYETEAPTPSGFHAGINRREPGLNPRGAEARRVAISD